MRLLLFDIDGTLLWGGPAKQAFKGAMEEVYGTAGPIDNHEFSGKTDPQIARELLRRAGLADADIDGGLPGLWNAYVSRMERLIDQHPVTLLPGVTELLEALSAFSDVALALVTGNIEAGAGLKLRSAGLEGHFAVGGYGSDAEVRNHLPPIAIERAARTWDRRFAGDEVVVIGDTPRDVECGRHSGTRTVAVATGRYGYDDLVATRPDHVLPDLSDRDQVVEILLG